MKPEQAQDAWRASWYVALGAGWAGVLLLALSWVIAGKPFWVSLLDGTGGWTIYPPLSALPQTIPGSPAPALKQDVLAPLVCIGLFLAGWLRAWVQRRRHGHRHGAGRFWLSWLLVLPLLGQASGLLISYQLIRTAEEQFQEEMQPPLTDDLNNELDVEEMDDALKSRGDTTR